MKISKTLFLICISFFIHFQSFAQDLKSDFLSTNISYVKFCDYEYIHPEGFGMFNFEKGMFNLGLNYNHRFKKYFDLGGYAGFGVYEEWYVEKSYGTVTMSNNKMSCSISSGLNAKLQLIKLFTDNIKFDLYLSTNLGFIYFMSSESDTMNVYPKKGFVPDFSGHLGLTYNFNKKWGILFETGYRSFKYHKFKNILNIDYCIGLIFRL